MRLELPNGLVGSNLRYILRAFRHRNYRLYFFGQGISLLGTWMQHTAMAWLVYRLTDSPLLLGLVGFAGQIPALLLTPLTGVLVDRYPGRRVLMVTQFLALVQAALLAALTFSGTIEVWHLMVMAAFLGSVNALDMPARHAFVIEMVETKDDLPSGIALNSSLFNAARLVGPCVAGGMVAVWNEGGCFLLNAASYLAVLGALAAMDVADQARTDGATDLWADLKGGISYVATSAPIRAVLLLLAAVSLVGMPYGVLLPVFARDVLGGGPHTLGFLVGATGAGSIIGATYVASRKSGARLQNLIPVGLSFFGLSIMLFAASRMLTLSMLALLCAGCGALVLFASCNTLIQTIVDDTKRGRVMSLYTLSFMGLGPFGALLVGALANHLGAPPTVVIYGLCCLAVAGLYSLRLPVITAALTPLPVPQKARRTVDDSALKPPRL
ncbi:MAG: MFS transporter [Candidatus Zipacnadales bacterium]